MSSSSLLIRSATEADLPQIIALDQALFDWYGAAESPEVIRGRLAVFPEGFIVLAEGGQLVGYGSAEKWSGQREPALDEEPALTHQPEGQIFCITTLAVRASHQRQGFGKVLLDRLMVIAREQACTHMMLETAHAADFYRRHGFQQVGERYQRGIKLFIFRFEL